MREIQLFSKTLKNKSHEFLYTENISLGTNLHYISNNAENRDATISPRKSTK